MTRPYTRAAITSIAAFIAAMALLVTAAQAAPPVFVTICHGAGLAGTTQYVTLTLPEQAVFGQAGHFNENGTPAAGHEQDYMGACVGEPSVEPSIEPSVEPSVEPSIESLPDTATN